jgi:hypothetical protein
MGTSRQALQRGPMTIAMPIIELASECGLQYVKFNCVRSMIPGNR